MAVLSFESRLPGPVARCIEAHGGRAVSAPSVRMVPLSSNQELLSFADRLIKGQIDVVIFLTGVGTQWLLEAVSGRFSDRSVSDALRRVTTVARGPKPLHVLRSHGIEPTITVPEPGTWVEIVQALDFSGRSVELAGKKVAVQECGASPDRLIDAIRQRGAQAIRVPVYQWALPEDTRPLEEAIRVLIDGGVRLVLLTNAQQVRQLLSFASAKGLEGPLRQAMKRTVIASIGPATSEAVLEAGLHVDLEASRPRMELLVEELAAQSGCLLREKENGKAVAAVQAVLPPAAQAAEPGLFLKACRLEPTPVTPVWLMRQAGRYMKEYRQIRSKVPFLEMCKDKELAARVTVSAAEKLGTDAAIIFSDLLLIVEPLGFCLEYTTQDGPVITGQPVDSNALDQLPEIEPEESLGFVFDAIRLARAALPRQTALIGFAGAPFTLASYVIEGGASRTFLRTKQLMYGDPGAWGGFMEKIGRALVKYLNAQIDAGADAVQLFDTWVGCLGPEDYRRCVLPYTRAVIQGIRPGVPVIHFGTGTAAFLRRMREAGGDIIGVDFRVELDEAWRTIGYDRGIQGNLDPAVLCGSRELIRQRVKEILLKAQGRPGHIFNLGHGILPQTPEENVAALVEYVHEFRGGGAGG
ncbi:MAG: uroporphyrinogen decarboxylase [Candidatus Omnitrophica bacterium]|nr:uroporphyrinogen decarboxylase [Candidatus Omnitrophota bacterium]